MANKENLRKLVAALRSGEYKQTVNRLNQGDSYCCLGVVCEIYQKEVGDLEIGADRRVYGSKTYDEASLSLPTAVRNWLELDGYDIPLRDTVASKLNDDGHDFLLIADEIESYYELEED